MLSIDRQTNEKIVGMDFEDFHLFSRNEPLHLLLDVLYVNDEEDELLFRYLVFGERILPWFNINPIPPFNGNDYW